MPTPGAAATTPRVVRRGGLDVLTWPSLTGLGVDAVVTTRNGGVSRGPYASLNLGLHVGDDPEAVVENRTRALAAVDARPEDAVFCVQSHGRAVHVATDADRGRGARDQADAVPETDALVTATPGLVLVVMVADCVPIVLLDPEAGVLAAVHAGWRGTLARVTAAAVETMTGLGARPDRIVAGVGPAVAPSRYEVGPEVAEAARTCFGADQAAATDGWAPVLRPSPSGRWLFDLWAANTRVLVESGVPADSIVVARTPTGEGGPFFSDRDARPCGRFALLARLT